MKADYKWPERAISAEFETQRERPDFGKVRRYQKFTDDLEECVRYCVNSIRNDREQELRRKSHHTGAL